MPGVGPIDVPPLTCLDRRFIPFMGDVPAHAASVELVAGLLRVIARVQVHGDVVRQRAEIIKFVQRGGQRRGVVPIRRREHPVQRDPVALDQQGPFHAQLAAVHRARPRAFPAARSLGDAPVHR